MLVGHTVREVMMADCPHLLPRLTLDVVVDHVVLPSGRRYFPVMEKDQLLSLLTLHRIKGVPRGQWTTTQVQDVIVPLIELKTVRPEDKLIAVFERMVAFEHFCSFEEFLGGQQEKYITTSLNFVPTCCLMAAFYTCKP